jgi:alcohol dehydrogenase (NADP+)
MKTIKDPIFAKSYAAEFANAPLAPYQIARRQPGPNDILIDIHYCGVCHSDIHQARNEWGGSIYPMVPGHEITGLVSKIGSAVRTFKVGDTIGVGCIVESCHVCSSCDEKLEQYCENGFIGTYNSTDKDGTLTYGGYSTQITVNEKFCLKIPKNLPLDKAAPLLCAGITTYSPLKQWNVKKGDRVAVVGLGGLGHMAVKLASAMGAEVTVLSSSHKKQSDAERLGAKNFASTAEPETFKALAGHFHLIINTVSADINLNEYLNLLKRDGTMVLLGVPEKSAALFAFPLIMGRRRLAGSLIGGIQETQEMLDFCGKHGITSDIEVISASDVNTAFDRMLRGDVRYRFVIDIKKSFS